MSALRKVERRKAQAKRDADEGLLLLGEMYARRRRVTERIFIDVRNDPRFAEMSDADLREAIAKFLDEEGFDG